MTASQSVWVTYVPQRSGSIPGTCPWNSASAQAAITKLDTALDSVNQYRSNYGAVQNRLESALNNLETYTENVAASESRIETRTSRSRPHENVQVPGSAASRYGHPSAKPMDWVRRVATHLIKQIRFKTSPPVRPAGFFLPTTLGSSSLYSDRSHSYDPRVCEFASTSRTAIGYSPPSLFDGTPLYTHKQ